MKRKNSLLKGGKVDIYGCLWTKHIIMDSEGDGRALVPDDLEQHQSWGGTMPKEDRSGRWTDTAMNIYYLQLTIAGDNSEDWSGFTRNLEDGDLQSFNFPNCYNIHPSFSPCHLWGLCIRRFAGNCKKQWSGRRLSCTNILGMHCINFGWTSHISFQHDFWGSNLSSSTSHKSYRPLTTFSFWIQVSFANLVHNGL